MAPSAKRTKCTNDVKTRKKRLHRFVEEAARGEHPGVVIRNVDVLKQEISVAIDADVSDSENLEDVPSVQEHSGASIFGEGVVSRGPAVRLPPKRIAAANNTSKPEVIDLFSSSSSSDDSDTNEEESTPSDCSRLQSEEDWRSQREESENSSKTPNSDGDVSAECKKLDQAGKNLGVNESAPPETHELTSTSGPEVDRENPIIGSANARDESDYVSPNIDELDDEMVENLDVTEKEETEFIERYRLRIPLQRLGSNSNQAMREHSCAQDEKALPTPEAPPLEVIFDGKVYTVGKCYNYREGENNVIVGIKSFIRDGNKGEYAVEAMLIIPFEETILGDTDFKPVDFVQVEGARRLRLEGFGDESADVSVPPTLVYRPALPGSFHFAFSYNTTARRCGQRGTPRFLELFAGAGGMHSGFHNAGFASAMAVEKDPFAVQTLTWNNSPCPIFPGDVTTFLSCAKDPRYRESLGEISHIHCSSPCQGFSMANRTGGQNDEKNNNLSYTIVDAVRIFRPTTATFENVTGMIQKKCSVYLINILKQLLELGYQFRCLIMRAGDFGDPQKRPRLIILAAKNGTPLPHAPKPTHGSSSKLLTPLRTVEDAIGFLPDKDDSRHTNMGHSGTKLTPDGPHSVVLDADGLAGAIRCGNQPFHYKRHRKIRVREAALLQSFPVDYRFFGSLKEQYRQVGNSVPLKLATKIAESVKEALEYEYENQ